MKSEASDDLVQISLPRVFDIQALQVAKEVTVVYTVVTDRWG
jgi:hypothetical protein